MLWGLSKLEVREFKKNKRTLKRRIRRIIFLCVLITITLFCSSVLFIGISFFKADTAILTDYFCSYIAQSMSSEYFLEQMGIDSLYKLRPDSEKFLAWVDNVKSNSNQNRVRVSKKAMSDKDNIYKELDNPEHNSKNLTAAHPQMPGGPNYLDSGDMFKLRIAVNSSIIYNDEKSNRDNTIGYLNEYADKNFRRSSFKHLLNYFNNQSITEILDKDGKVIATVTASISEGYIMVLGLLFITGVIISGFLALFIGLIFSKLLTIPISGPLLQLDDKIRKIATSSCEDAMTSHICIKKPLREIDMLADSTNNIMERMKEYNVLLMAQNQELEAQNEELANSKIRIEEAQNMLIQTESMASVGQLTAAITHEINTPLGAISSNAQLSEMLLSRVFGLETVHANDELLELLTQLQESNNVSIMACNRVNQIIRSLKNFSKIDQAEFQEADINEGLRSVLTLTSNLWKKKIVIHEEYGNIPKIKCFHGMLNQVFMNLIVNAIQAIEEKGNIYVRTWQDNQLMKISIRDDGIGISEENIGKIFDNGFTTKGNSLGMGLGLSICLSIIKKHNGDITVTSKPGIGSEFIVSVPINATKEVN